MFAIPAASAPSELDPTFDSDGKTTNSVYGYVEALALQPDGKSVVLGDDQYIVLGDDQYIKLIRHNPGGSMDTVFGTNGRGGGSFNPTEIYANGEIDDLVLQPDGKIVVAVYTTFSPGCESARLNEFDLVLARFNPDGTLDSSFDGDGKVIVPEVEGKAQAVALRGDKSVVAGCTDDGTDDDFTITRLDPDGSQDSSFDGDGKLTNGGKTWKEDGKPAVYDPEAMTYKATRALTANALLRMRYAGERQAEPATSNAVLVKAQAYLSQPITPTTVAKNASFTTYGYLKAYHSDASHALTYSPIRYFTIRQGNDKGLNE